MAFEVYEAENTVSSSVPSIRIGKINIVLSKSFMDQLGENTKKVELAFDKDNQVIRIKAVAENVKGLILDKTKIPAKNFLKHFGIEKEDRYEAKYDKKEKAFYVQL